MLSTIHITGSTMYIPRAVPLELVIVTVAKEERGCPLFIVTHTSSESPSFTV